LERFDLGHDDGEPQQQADAKNQQSELGKTHPTFPFR
jgi:hypothetical protein